MGKNKGEAVGPLDRSVGHLLHRALQRALDIYDKAGGAGAVSQRQYAVLAAASAADSATQTALVLATGIDRSTLADLVGRMTDKGLLTRERSSQDARANNVRLTDAGREALAQAAPIAAAADEAILALAPSGKRDAFIKALQGVATGALPEKAAGKQAKAEKKSAKKARKQAKKAAAQPVQDPPEA